MDPPLPEVRAVNREFAERWKERKEKENQAREKQGKSPIPTPDSTTEPESSSSAEGEVDYLSWPDPNAEATGG